LLCVLQLYQASQAQSDAAQRAEALLRGKVGEAELLEGLDSRVSTAQFTELARFVQVRWGSFIVFALNLWDCVVGCAIGITSYVCWMLLLQRDLVARLDQPCPAHASSSKGVVQLTTRLSQLEAVVTAQVRYRHVCALGHAKWACRASDASSCLPNIRRLVLLLQDKLIQGLQRELSGKASTRDIQAAGYATQAALEAGLTAASDRRGLVTHGELEAALAGKAEVGHVEAAIRDIHTLHGELGSRALRDDVTVFVEQRVAATLATARAAVKTVSEDCSRAISELRRAIDVKAGKDEAPGNWKAKVRRGHGFSCYVRLCYVLLRAVD
jgi:hypothetical protein